MVIYTLPILTVVSDNKALLLSSLYSKEKQREGFLKAKGLFFFGQFCKFSDSDALSSDTDPVFTTGTRVRSSLNQRQAV